MWDEAVSVALKAIAKRRKADVFLYNGAITYDSVQKFLDLVDGALHQNRIVSKDNQVISGAKANRNVALFLCTPGGDPDSAYRLMCFLQDHYSRIFVYVLGMCKSAGTLAAAGATEIVFGPRGELGPVDTLMANSDSGEYFSTLDVMTGIETINKAWIEFFHAFSDSLRDKGVSGSDLEKAILGETDAIFGPLVKQLAKGLTYQRLGEIQRARDIARFYLAALSPQNMPNATFDQLVEGFPSHGCVIDSDIAEGLGFTVTRLRRNESGLRGWQDGSVMRDGEPLLLDCMAKL